MRSTSPHIQLAAATERPPAALPNAVLGMLLFVFAEIMFFAGMISAFSIIKAAAPLWPPPGQPRLPVEATAVNTLALLASGVFLYRAGRRHRRDPAGALRPLGVAMALGAGFVLLQGAEWVALLGQGFTLRSSNLGSFFYLIVGMHALHAVAALGVLAYTWRRLHNGWRARHQLAAAEVFWYFVVGVWPVLYAVVYL